MANSYYNNSKIDGETMDAAVLEAIESGFALVEADCLKIDENLADLDTPATARTNLGLDTAAVEPVASFCQTANNLSDLADTPTARTNLGLGTMSVETATDYLVLATGGTIESDITLEDTNYTITFDDELGEGYGMILFREWDGSAYDNQAYIESNNTDDKLIFARYNALGTAITSQMELNYQGYVRVTTGDLVVDNNLGVGTTGTYAPLQVTSSGTASLPAVVTGTQGKFQNSNLTSDDSGLVIVSGSSGESFISMTDQNHVSAGKIVYDNATDSFIFHTSAFNTMWLKADGALGLSTSTPDARLHVHGGGVATSPTLTSGTLAKFNRSTAGDSNSGINITAGAAGQSFIDFSDTTDADVGKITYDHNLNSMIFQVNTTEAARFDLTKHFMVGRTSSSGAANDSGVVIRQEGYITSAMDGTGTNFHAFFINNAASSATTVGSISSNTSTTSYNTSSDYRLKHDIQQMGWDISVDRICKLKPSTFKWNLNDDVDEGFIAHELQEVVPWAVTGVKDGDENQQVDYSKVVTLLTSGLQAAYAMIGDLEQRISELEG